MYVEQNLKGTRGQTFDRSPPLWRQPLLQVFLCLFFLYPSRDCLCQKVVFSYENSNIKKMKA